MVAVPPETTNRSPVLAECLGEGGSSEAAEQPGLLGELPTGTLELAARRWREAERLADLADLQPMTLDDAALHQRILVELTAPLRLEDWPAPNPPRPLHDGWVNDEVTDEDRAAFESLVAARPGIGPEELATAAQELRWPITPYRRLAAVPNPSSDRPVPALAAAPASQDHPRVPWPPRPPRVLDLTSHWAGPLATALLAEAGAEVTKLDPSCRPDGFRSRPALYHHLNGTKALLDLDLRLDRDRDRFEAELSEADLLIESFSRRVLANLGYGPDRLARLNPRLVVVSIKAFPASTPEAAWLAYGPGVHAASGLGWSRADERPEPAPIAYPDVVAGLTAYAAAVAGLARAHRTGRQDLRSEQAAVEITLAGSIAPLVHLARATGAGAAAGEVDRA